MPFRITIMAGPISEIRMPMLLSPVRTMQYGTVKGKRERRKMEGKEKRILTAEY